MESAFAQRIYDVSQFLLKIPCFTMQQMVSPTVIITGTVKWPWPIAFKRWMKW